MVKNLPANAGDIRDVSSIPGLGRSPGGGHGYPLQYSYLENPMDREAWRATVHRVAHSWTRLKQLSKHTCACCYQGVIASTLSKLNQLECSTYVQIFFGLFCLFTFSLTRYADFQSYFSQYLFPSLSFSEIVSYICNMVRFCCNILHSILGSSVS